LRNEQKRQARDKSKQDKKEAELKAKISENT
jgi:hypothetical protein